MGWEQRKKGGRYDAKRTAADGRLGQEGRKLRVCELENRLCNLCLPYQRGTTPDSKPHERDFANLIDELLRLFLEEELFTFVLMPEVEATNNLSERLLRSPAQDRKAGRTNKTAAGAHRLQWTPLSRPKKCIPSVQYRVWIQFHIPTPTEPTCPLAFLFAPQTLHRGLRVCGANKNAFPDRQLVPERPPWYTSQGVRPSSDWCGRSSL